MVLVLSDDDLVPLIDLAEVADVVEDALLKQTAGAVERPDRPHYQVGSGLKGDDPLGTGLVMPAYVHGADYFATKLVSIHERNPALNLPTLHAQIVLSDARTGEPVSFMNGIRITNARTGCIGGLATRELANKPVRLAVIGAGAQARWQVRAIAALVGVEHVAVYSPSESKRECVADLAERGIAATAAESADAAVRDANVVVTATTSTEPVFSADALQPGTLVIAVGAYESSMRELEAGVFDRATQIFADVPEEVITIGDLVDTQLTVDDLQPMGALFGSAERTSRDEIIVVESVGSAVFDAATAGHLYDVARERDAGAEQGL